MPYEIRKGTEIWHKKDGVWSLKQKAKTPENAKATLRLLYGIESGGIKPNSREWIKK